MTKHIDRYPLAPTEQQSIAYHWHLAFRDQRRIDAGIQYRTGPRFGQQLATIRAGEQEVR